jgi:hypothetical protein
LNHDIDRDNLNKEWVETAADMARLLFPNGRKRYVEELDERINAFDRVRGTLDRSPKTFWDCFSDAIQRQHHEGRAI